MDFLDIQIGYSSVILASTIRGTVLTARGWGSAFCRPGDLSNYDGDLGNNSRVEARTSIVGGQGQREKILPKIAGVGVLGQIVLRFENLVDQRLEFFKRGFKQSERFKLHNLSGSPLSSRPPVRLTGDVRPSIVLVALEPRY